jgi:hypothetical protein
MGRNSSRFPGEKTNVGSLLAWRRVTEEAIVFEAMNTSMSGAYSRTFRAMS